MWRWQRKYWLPSDHILSGQYHHVSTKEAKMVIGNPLQEYVIEPLAEPVPAPQETPEEQWPQPAPDPTEVPA
jgi:hypothetical protein